MSVVGIDLGTQFSKVAVAFRKKISMVPNEQSKFETPTLIGFTEKQREIGEAAETSFSRNFRNTVSSVKRYLGRDFDDPTLGDELRKWNYCKVNRSEDNKIAFEVLTSEGPKELVPEQILCAFLRQLKEFTTKNLDGLPVKDCVITCPSYFTDAQRRAVMAAANLSELNVLRLLNETTATAISYGLFRKLEENRRVMFVDIGYSNTQISIADFGPSQLEMYATSCDAFLGARDFDYILFDHFRKQIETLHHVDLSTEPRARLRLMKGVERVKKLLSGNRDAVFLLECLVNDIDFTLRITREEFDNLCQPLLTKLSECVSSAIAEMRSRDRVKFPVNTGDTTANAKPAEKAPLIHSVEIIGGASRIKCVQEGLMTMLKQQIPESNIDKLCTTLNSDECVARGAALMCAMLSPIFKVREFQVKDMNNWPVMMTYPSSKSAGAEENNTSNKDGTSGSGDNLTRQIVLQRYAPCPCTAKITFYKKEGFKVVLEHPKDEVKVNDTDSLKVEYPMKCNLGIGEFNIDVMELSPNAIKDPQIKLSLSLNKHGLVETPQAELIEFVKREVETKPEPMDVDKPTDKPAAESAKPDTSAKDVSDQTKTGNAQDSSDNKENAQKPPQEPPQNQTHEELQEQLAEIPHEQDQSKPNENVENKSNQDQEMVDKSKSNEAPEVNKTSNDSKTEATKPADTSKAPADASTAPAKKKKDKKKITRDLVVTGKFYSQINLQKMKDWMEVEAQLANVDRIVKETNDRRNELETYVYDMRDKIDDTHKDFMSEANKEAFLQQLDGVEQWLYDEGESANKTAYMEKMQELKKIGDPMLSKYWEAEQRPHRFDVLKKLIMTYQQFADSTEEKYAHIGAEDREIVRKAANEVDEWMLNKLIQQDKLKLYEPPAVMCSEIDAKYRELLNKCQPVVTKPKPEPPKPEPPKAEPSKTETAKPETGKPDSQPEVKKEEQNANANKSQEAGSKKESEGNKEQQQETLATTVADGVENNIDTDKPMPDIQENTQSGKVTEETPKS